MGQAVAAMLEGMRASRDLRLQHVEGGCLITVGATVLFDYDAADTAMRNMAISALRRLGFAGRRVAAGRGVAESDVGALHNPGPRGGAAGGVRPPPPRRPRQRAQGGRGRAA